MPPRLPQSVRAASPEDVPALSGLCRQLGYPVQEPVFSERVGRLIAHPVDHLLVVAPALEDDRRLLGALHAVRRTVLELEDSVEITALIVDEQVRGTGIGRVLVGAAERWTRDQGFHLLRLRANTVRVQAHAFYEHLGFRVLKQQLAFIKEL